ncbi:MAG: PAS domain-containing sensor histidine kinase [Anaerolineae bacterium]|nr:PAS domain-containing sensor histidine kinase [Anaerolineae bacterium]
MERKEKTDFIDFDVINRINASEKRQILVIADAPEIHKQVKQVVQGLVFNGHKLSYLGVHSIAEAEQALATQPDIAVVLFDLLYKDELSHEAAYRFIQTAQNYLPIRVFVYVNLAEVTAYYDLRRLNVAGIRLKSDFTETKLRFDICIALKKYEHLAALERSNRALDKQVVAQRAEIEDLKVIERDGAPFRAILEATSDLVSIADAQGQIQYTNLGGRKLVGISKDEDITQYNITDFYSEEISRQLMQELLPQVIERGIGHREFPIITKDGSEILVDHVILAHKSSDGQIEYFSTIARDITSYKQLEASLRARKEFLQLVMNNIPQFIYWKDIKSVFKGCNQNFAQIAGFASPEEVVGKTDYDMPWREGEAEFYQMQEYEIMLRNQPEYHIIETQLHADETLLWLDTNKIPLHDDQGNVIGILGTYEDITDRIEAEIALQKYSGRLKKMVDERTQALSKALESLKAAQEQVVETEKMAALGGLVAGVAHEISTPVGIGVTAASTLQDETEAFLACYQQGRLKRSTLDEYIKIAQESAHLILKNLTRASELVQSFKQVAVDQTNLEYRRFIVRAYLEEVLRSLKPQLKRTNHRIRVMGDNELVIESFPGAFSQIITNLIMNSVIHAYDEDNAGLLEFKLFQQGDYLVIEYCDDGRGISVENLNKIFQPFFTTARERGGSGLGLNIVYNLVTQKLKGDITCKSEFGKGTQFVIRIPLRLKQAAYDAK